MEATAKTSQVPVWLPDEERKAARRDLGLSVVISGQRLETTSAMMTDVSALGCRISGVTKATIGTFLQIEVPGFTAFTGWIAWHRTTEFGIDFAHALPKTVVDHLIALTG